MMQWLFLWFSHPVMFNSLQLHGLSLTISQSLLRFMSIASVMPSSHLILWHPLFLLPSIFPSIRDFFNESVVHIRWPKYRVLASASVFPMTIQGRFPLRLTGLISLLCKHLWVQHHSSKASILWCSAFFTIQLSQLYVTTGKTIVLAIRTFVGRVMSLLLNTLSRIIISFLPRSNCLLILWLQSPSVVILEPLHGSLPCHGEGVYVTQWSYEPCLVGPPKVDRS